MLLSIRRLVSAEVLGSSTL
ncbi:unnamed protein product [Linum tenue]|uniref:Uncharacterized protein n=1 Tax=Linum tenue TaxID=586396 RepID=A0AAV0I3Y8_9ROSI|nr:unnamed protein product [Linum tenue]